MKRIIALLLCLLTLSALLVGCADKEEEDKGAIIPVYLDTQITTFDPAYAYTDDAAIKFLGLIYQGLTEIDAGGKLKNLLMKSYEYTEDPVKGKYELEITLNNTCWSDGRQVMADDFVYAWKRILDPEFHSEAASMLYDIRNAKEANAGDVSIDDVGLYAADITLIEVEFAHSIDPKVFLEYCASPALVPLREDIVAKGTDWSTNPAILVTSGPFGVRNFTPGTLIVLDRNIYYYRDIKKDGLKKYVTPYRLVMVMSKTAEEQVEDFKNGRVQYLDYIPLSLREEYAKKVTVQDTMNTHTYFFNTTRAPFDNADVRKALSMAIDREALADLVVYAKAATGFVPDGVGKVSGKKNFRALSGNVLSTSADIEGAKALISSAGVKTKSFTITIRENEVDRAVAEYCAEQWKQLGFNVDIVSLGTKKYSENEYDMFADLFAAAYEDGDFDVIAIDWQCLSTLAWSTFAPFARDFAGGKMDLAAGIEKGEFELTPHITGYDSEEYNAVIEEAFAETDPAKRDEILVKAEKILAEDMPVMPLFVYQDAYVMSKSLGLSGAKTAFYGYRKFNKLSFKGYETFETEELNPKKKMVEE